MKRAYLVLLSLLLIIGCTCKRTPRTIINYYFSDTDGDDTRTSAQAQSPLTPWKTLSKFNSVFSTFLAGDIARFKRGDTFAGSVTINKSGSAGSPIKLSTYGTGASPIFTGMTSVAAWTSIGTNLWQSTAAVSTLASLNMVTIGGNFAPIGKWPTTGWNTVNSSVGGTSLTSTSLNGTPTADWKDATVAIRKNHWIIDKSVIVSQSGTTINFTNPTSYNITNGYGFIIQDKKEACDVQNEWWYDLATKKIGMYSVGSPTAVQVSSVDNLVNIGAFTYIEFDSISFVGSNSNQILISSGNNIDFEGCSFSYSGINAITVNAGGHHITVNGCTAERTNNNFITGGGGVNWTVTNNYIHNTALVPGMGSSRDGTYTAIYNTGSNSLIQYNIIKRTGYNGIHFNGGNVQILNNLVDSFDMVKDDGGGIYTYTGVTTTTYLQRTVKKNIVLNGGGAGPGTNTSNSDAFGIYLDDNTSQTTYDSNTVALNGSSGIYIHSSHACTLTNNTVWNNVLTGGYGQVLEIFPGATATDPVRNMTFTGNRIIAKQTNQILAWYTTNEANMAAWPTPSGAWNNNYYARPINDATATNTFQVNRSSGNQTTNLAGWVTASGGLDAASVKSPVAITNVNDIRFDYNATNSPITINLSGITYKNVVGTNFSGTYVLQPWTSQVLIKTGTGGNTPPTANAGTNQTITSPASSVTLSGSGTDADGTITGYAWAKTSGGAATISAPTSASTAVNGLVPGVYQFTLTVTDNGGLTATNTVTVTVNSAPPANIPPVADAGTDKSIVLPTNSVSQVGSGTDADGTVNSYAWVKISGPTTYNIVSPSAASTTISNLVQGTYQFQLTVTDNLGATGTDNMTIVVSPAPANIPPSVNAGVDQTKTLPANSAAMAATASDADGSISAYSWTKTSGPATYTISNPAILNPTISGLVQGVYQFTLTVTDNGGAGVSDNMTITVNGANIIPSVNAGVDITVPNLTTMVHVTGTGTDPDGFIATYAWSQQSGPNVAIIATPGAAATDLTGLTNGTYTFRLTVTDNQGATNFDLVNVTVLGSPNPPGIKFRFSSFKYGTVSDGSGLNLDWAVVDDSAIIRYDIQQSSDSVNFSTYGIVDNTQFTFFYQYPVKLICTRYYHGRCTQKKMSVVPTQFYWRIKAVDDKLVAYYSDILKTL